MSHQKCMEATDAKTALALHDRTYMMSDSPVVGRRGRLEAAHVCKLLDELEPAEVAALADEYLTGEPLDSFIAIRLAEARDFVKGTVAA